MEPVSVSQDSHRHELGDPLELSPSALWLNSYLAQRGEVESAGREELQAWLWPSRLAPRCMGCPGVLQPLSEQEKGCCLNSPPKSYGNISCDQA